MRNTLDIYTYIRQIFLHFLLQMHVFELLLNSYSLLINNQSVKKVNFNLNIICKLCSNYNDYEKGIRVGKCESLKLLA